MKRFFSFRLAFVLTLVTSLALFFYSYTQVDLNLTLSQVSIFQTVQKFFIHIGYFERPLSTFLYLGIISSMFGLYVWLWKAARMGLLTQKHVWILVGVVVASLVLSYPAFSYDMFNYLFTAKTVLLYHKNPYEVIPLQFSGVDPFLTFMRWTHLPSAYTPLWIGMSLVPYVMGFGYFLVILWNFKFLMALFYLLTVWAVGRIAHILKKEDATSALVFFAFNPLVIVESLVSGHNDIVMMGLCMVGVLVLVRKEWWTALFFLALSVGLKLMTVFLYPWMLWMSIYKRTVTIKHMYVPVLFLTGALVLVAVRREILPWYLVWIVPFAAFVSRDPLISLTTIGASVGLLLTYSPYLYIGNWDGPVVGIKFMVGVIPLVVGIVVGLVLRLQKRSFT